MGRTRAFQVDVALDQALQLFWTKGYEATSVDDLGRATGLSKSSLYLAFGSKHALFLTCLVRYTEQVGRVLQSCGEERVPGALLVDRLLKRLVELTRVGNTSRGCFLGNTSLELGGRDAAARRRVRAGLRAVDSVFSRVVRTGVADGSLPATLDPKRTGQFLTSNAQGMLVLAKAGASRTELAALRQLIVSKLTQEERP